jgi:tetratricopeptide (TPR) repeat protein
LKRTILPLTTLLASALFALLLTMAPPVAMAEVEIDLGDTEEASPTPTAAPAREVPTATPVPSRSEEVEVLDAGGDETADKPEPTPVPAAPEVRGVMKMRDYYDAGIRSYKAGEYQQAIRYLEQALKTKDPYTKDYYYAEANAMLGVIYQFYFTVPGNRAKAYRYYQEALRIDPETETARKYIRQVRPR